MQKTILCLVFSVLGLLFLHWLFIVTFIFGLVGLYYGVKAKGEPAGLRGVGLAISSVDTLLGLFCVVVAIYSIRWVNTSHIPFYRF